MEYYTGIKNEILQFVTKLAHLETIVFNVIRQSKNDKYHMFYIICDN